MGVSKFVLKLRLYKDEQKSEIYPNVFPHTRCNTTDTSMPFIICFFLPCLPVGLKLIYLAKCLKLRTSTNSPDVDNTRLQRYFRCPNKVPVSPCLQNTPENGTLCASGICHLAAPARKCPPVPQSC